MIPCTLAAFVPCTLLCFASSSDQLKGFDQRFMTMVQDGRVMVVVQTEHDICTEPLLAPPEPYGAVVDATDDIAPGTRELIARVRLPVPRPTSFEPPNEAWKRPFEDALLLEPRR